MIWTAKHWHLGMAQAYRIDELAIARILLDHGIYTGHCGGYDVAVWPCPTASAVLDKLFGYKRDGNESQEKTRAGARVSAGLANSEVPGQSAEQQSNARTEILRQAAGQIVADWPDCECHAFERVVAKWLLREAGQSERRYETPDGLAMYGEADEYAVAAAYTYLQQRFEDEEQTTASGVNAGQEASPGGADEAPDKAKGSALTEPCSAGDDGMGVWTSPRPHCPCFLHYNPPRKWWRMACACECDHESEATA